jgi:hypothetical protein
MPPKYFDLNIGENVLTHLDIDDALKEIISNALDEHTQNNITKSIKIYKKNNKWIIKDYGLGITEKSFKFNINKEKILNDHTIGLYGYGLKDALGVLYNRGIKIRIVTLKKIFVPIMKQKDGFNEDTIHLEIFANKTDEIDVGTEFIFDGLSDEYMNKAKKKFIQFLKPNILYGTNKYKIFEMDGCQNLFLNGVEVYSDTGFHFSYDLQATSDINKLFNRDRKQIDLEPIRLKHIKKIWESVELYDNNDNFINDILYYKIANILKLDSDKLQEFNSISILRNILSQLNSSDNYVFVNKKDKINKQINEQIIKDDRLLFRLGDGFLKKFKIKNIKYLNHKEIFYGNTFDETNLPIHTLLCYNTKKENIEIIKNLINNAIKQIEEIIEISDDIKSKFTNIEFIDNEKIIYDDEDNEDNEDNEIDFDFSGDEYKINMEYAKNKNKLVGSIFNHIISNYNGDKNILYEKIGELVINQNKKDWKILTADV